MGVWSGEGEKHERVERNSGGGGASGVYPPAMKFLTVSWCNLMHFGRLIYDNIGMI